MLSSWSVQICLEAIEVAVGKILLIRLINVCVSA